MAKPDSWAVLFKDPKAPFILMDSPREMLGNALRYLGYSVNTKNPKEVQAAGQLLLQAKKSRYFRDLEEMMEAVAERCRVLAQDPETLRRHTLFHWWPRTKELA